MRNLLYVTLFVFLATVIAAAQSANDYVIGPQDVLSITVFDQMDLSGKYPVELDGSFTFPLIGRVQAGGKTIKQFEDELRMRLADGFFKNPQITVSIEQYLSQRIFVTGEVRNAGAYALTRDMTLIEALAKAGSTTQTASDEVLVVRGDKGAEQAPVEPDKANASKETIRINLKDLQSGVAGANNVELRDGDTIYVAKAELVYVFGQVKNPGSYPIKSDTTILQALSLAGGVTPTGALNRVHVIRTVNGEQKEVKVKLTDPVEPGDTITIPERFF